MERIYEPEVVANYNEIVFEGPTKREVAHLNSQWLSENSQDLYKIKPDKIIA